MVSIARLSMTKQWLGQKCTTETYSRLKLRQRRLKLWCDQLKWLVFDIKLLVSTAEKSK